MNSVSLASRSRNLGNSNSTNMFYSNSAQIPELESAEVKSGMPINIFNMNTPQTMSMVDAMDNSINEFEDLNFFSIRQSRRDKELVCMRINIILYIFEKM